MKKFRQVEHLECVVGLRSKVYLTAVPMWYFFRNQNRGKKRGYRDEKLNFKGKVYNKAKSKLFPLLAEVTFVSSEIEDSLYVGKISQKIW